MFSSLYNSPETAMFGRNRLWQVQLAEMGPGGTFSEGTVNFMTSLGLTIFTLCACAQQEGRVFGCVVSFLSCLHF